MIKSDFHVHSLYCDGKDSPTETVAAAIESGVKILGFSGHGYTPFDHSYCMSREGERKYIAEVNSLKEQFAGKIKLLCGVEQDMYSGKATRGFDYVIGSVHYVRAGGELLPIDFYPNDTDRIINEHFDGEFDLFAESYFESIKNVITATGADIIGHFDLVAKYMEANGYSESDRYLTAAEAAVKALCAFEVPFEVNTGAMARGLRTVPYPSENILNLINRHGGRLIFCSDCHDKDKLCYQFEQALQPVYAAGITDADIVSGDEFYSRINNKNK